MSSPGARQAAAPLAVVVMGVSGSGKTAVGRALADDLGAPFLEGDGFHPEANVEKMSAGVPLTDDDRWPWLDAIGAAAANAEGSVVVACSALKRAYRERLVRAAGKPVLFVFLDGRRETLAARMAARKGHFMPASLLDSQLATLEPPGPDEPAIRVPVEPPLAEVIAAAKAGVAAYGAQANGGRASRAPAARRRRS